MTTHEFYDQASTILHRVHNATILEDFRAMVSRDAAGQREMNESDWRFALREIDNQISWLKAIFYPPTKAELAFKSWVEQHLRLPSAA